MDMHTVTMARTEARERYLEYRDHGDTAEDEAMARGYLALARGYDVIRLDDTIAAGGLDGNGRPRLAVMRADEPYAYLRHRRDGNVRYALEPDPDSRRRHGVYTLSRVLPTEHETRWSWRGGFRAMVPTVPPRLRPAHHLRNYEVLWEVDEWSEHRVPAPPGDPALLKHLGGMLYSVLAAWELTDLERAVLAGGRLV